MGREESLWSMASVRDRERGFMAELEHRFIAKESVFWKVGYVRVAPHQLNNGKEFGEHQTCQVSRIPRESHGFWQFLKAHGRETQCSRIFVNLTECCDQGVQFFCTRTRL